MKEVRSELEERLRATKDRFLDFPKNQHEFTTRYSHDYREAARDYVNAYRALDQFLSSTKGE